MARVCSALNVPRPERGYWAKKAFGKAPVVPALPDARPGDQMAWSPGGGMVTVVRPLPRPPVPGRKKRSKPTTPLPDEHPLIKGAKAHFEGGGLSYDVGYLKPAKRLLVDLAVTKTGLDKALAFANQLFLSLEAKGYPVVIASHAEHLRREDLDEREKPGPNPGYNNLWSPYRCTVTYLGTVAIGLTIVEMSEEVEARYVNGKYVREAEYVPPRRRRYAVDTTWTTTKAFTTGRLCLQAYSPYWRAKWVRQWRETNDRDLGSRISSIIKELEQSVVEIAGLVEESERQAAIEHERWIADREQWEREEAERRTAQALKDSKKDLLQIIDAWTESRRLEQFFAEADKQIADLTDRERVRMSERLRLGRELIGNTQALYRFIGWRSPAERLRASDAPADEEAEDP
jgi:hypothetical protein